jgi:shikimate dehydrogenase
VQYLDFPVEDSALLPLLLARTDIIGLNVTVPYKERIIPFLDELSQEAAAIGAVNCVVREGGKWVGYNTDRQAFEGSLAGFLSGTDGGMSVQDEIRMPESICLSMENKDSLPEETAESILKELPCGNIKALILGSGGASKAAAYALDRLGIEYAVVSRGADMSHGTRRHGTLCGAAGAVGAAGEQAEYDGRKECSGEIKMGGRGERYKFSQSKEWFNNARVLRYGDVGREVLDSHKLIINATPLGMFPFVEGKPAIPYGLLTRQHFLYDMVYNPPLTAFLAEGRRRGCNIKNGLEMLHRQAELSWQKFSSVI